jgi:hypothetical protein
VEVLHILGANKIDPASVHIGGADCNGELSYEADDTLL